MGLALDTRTCDVSLRLTCIGCFAFATVFFIVLAAAANVKIHLFGFIPLTASVTLALLLIYRWRKAQPPGLEFNLHIFGRRTLQRIDFQASVSILDVLIGILDIVFAVLTLARSTRGWHKRSTGALGAYASMPLFVDAIVHFQFALRILAMPLSTKMRSAYVAAYDQEMDEMQQSDSQPITMQLPSNEVV